MIKTGEVDFFCYHRDRPGSAALRDELREEHWSYMDRYQAELIARGPTLTDDGDAATGSVHIVGLPDAAAARAFAFDEPNYQAGVYRDVLLRRWRNLLGHTMWEYRGDRERGHRFLVLGLGAGPADPTGPARPTGPTHPAGATGPAADLDLPPDRGDLIAYGPLLSDDGAAWLGTAALLQAPDARAARGLLTVERYAAIEVHHWDFGGRPS
jgi:uncharacterized protein YciI